MATGQLSPVIHYLRRLSMPGSAAGLADRQLLERFVYHGEETAFRALVQRHGPAVFRVCRRVLPDPNDADDAFQATFLLLVQKASSLRQPDLLGPWLYGVAYRIARRAKADAARRRTHEKAVERRQSAAADQDLVWRDLRPVLDEAIYRLPPKYRLPFILCYVEGKTNAQVARQLDCPEGTIATRLSRARHMLRKRLGRHGLTLSVAALASELSRNVAAAQVPASLLESVSQGAVAYWVGQAKAAGVFSEKFIASISGGLRMMFLSKMRALVTVLVGVALATGGAGLLSYRAPAAEQADKQQEAAPSVQEERSLSICIYRTTNFEVKAATPEDARQIGQAAEDLRRSLALRWLGHELPAWAKPCPIRVKITKGPGKGATNFQLLEDGAIGVRGDVVAGSRGATSFRFEGGAVAQQSMILEGPLDRLVASTLPHEITHTVFASLLVAPRWADEGGAMLAEDPDDQKRYKNRLREIWKRGSFIPLRTLFAFPDFPKEKQLPAYLAEAYAVTRFLVKKQDRQGFLKFVALGIHQGWDKAAQSKCGYDDVEELERAWLAFEGLREGDNPGYQVDRKLQLAFGKDCQEVNAAIKLEFRSRHMVVAASRLIIEADDRVELSPCYIAAFDQEPDGRRPVQVTAIRASVARITFDQPIRNVTDTVKRKIVSVDLPGNMRILGNK